MNILITGGCGFIGSNLALNFKLKYPGNTIYVLDNLKRKGSELNINRLREAGIQFIHADIRLKEDLNFDFQIDIIIDAAAEPSVLSGSEGNGSTDYLINTNFGGTINTIELAKKHKAKFIFLSTSRVYPIDKLEAVAFEETETRFGFSQDQHLAGISGSGVAENFDIYGYRSLYGATKLASEFILWEYNKIFNLPVVVNRCGVITGPYQMGKIDQGVVVLWLARHYWKGALNYIGYGGMGKQLRDILHIEDLFNLLDWQIHNFDTINGKLFNVGGGLDSSVSLLELTSICQELTGNKINIKSVLEERPNDLRVYVTNNKYVEETCGWKPTKTVYNTLSDIYAWILQNEKSLKPILNN